MQQNPAKVSFRHANIWHELKLSPAFSFLHAIGTQSKFSKALGTLELATIPTAADTVLASLESPPT